MWGLFRVNQLNVCVPQCMRNNIKKDTTEITLVMVEAERNEHRTAVLDLAAGCD